MADQPDEPVDPTDLPLPSSSNAPMEMQDATASTSAMPFAEPTITAPKSKAQKQREYRRRIAASRTPEQAAAMKKLNSERQRNCRLRKAAYLAIASGLLESTTASTSRPGKRSNNVQMSNVPTEVQAAAASTSATPFAEPIMGQNNANESMPMPIKLEVISDGSEFKDDLDAYDKFSLLVSKKIKSLHSINARIRLMNAIQDLVDNFCAKNDHDLIDCSTHQTLSVPIVDGRVMVQNAVLQPMESDESHQVKQPAVTRSVHVQQLSIDPKPSSSFLPHAKKPKKTYSKRRKVTADENPIGESYVEVPVELETALPTEFVSLGLKTDPPPSHGVGEPRPHIDILEIKEEKIQDEESSSTMTTANEPATGSVSGITFINDPIPIKLEVMDMEEF